jgi:magnesium transporter
MAETAVNQEESTETLREMLKALGEGNTAVAVELLNLLHPAEIANTLESLPHRERKELWELIDEEYRGEVLAHLGDEVRASVIGAMETAELVAATEGLDVDDMADILQDLPEEETQKILQSMSNQDRMRLEHVLSYDEDTAGGLMNTDTITVRPDVTLDTVMRYLRLRGELPSTTDSLIVVERDDTYIGMLPLADILTHDPEDLVESMYKHDVKAIKASQSADEVAKRFETHDLVSSAVVDDEDKLLGRITIDDVVDIIREAGEAAFMAQGRLGEDDDIFAPIMISAKSRAVWLGINLVTALMAAWVIGLFQGTLEQIVALAVLMPIVASMGGIAGSQTLTLVIRGMAMGQVAQSNLKWLFNKELAVGVLNGILWATIMSGVAILWFDDFQIGAIIGVALVVNHLFANVSGVLIPIIMKKLEIDPAIAGGVVLTTVTDMMGFFVFLGLATIILL